MSAWRILFTTWGKKFLLYSPALVAVLLMLPRILSAQFGLFDDGRTYTTAHQILDGVWDMSIDNYEGRYRPMYWVFYTAPYALFGDHPSGHFAWNAIFLAMTVGILVSFIKRLHGSDLQAWASGMLFAFSGPVIENYYTLSKGEAIQLFWLRTSLWLWISLGRFQRRWQWAIAVVGIGLALLLANLSKETALVMIPISLAWLALAVLAQWFARPSRPVV